MSTMNETVRSSIDIAVDLSIIHIFQQLYEDVPYLFDVPQHNVEGSEDHLFAALSLAVALRMVRRSD